MLRSGLVSVTFRQFSPAQIIGLVKQAGLEGIEWGGDVHVPHGDLQRAQAVWRQTMDAGLRVSAYGSYYRLGSATSPPFSAVLETALALQTPTIRVWAGDQGSAQTASDHRNRLIEETRRVAEQAGQQGITLSFECHPNTLTDTRESAVQLLNAVAHPAVRTFWQPADDLSAAENLGVIGALSGWLTNVHVFHWRHYNERYPLSQGADRWSKYLRALAALPGDHDVSLEFVRDDSPVFFLEDAATLRHWLSTHLLT